MNAIAYLPKNILTVRARLAEAPCWNEEEQLLYWVDIYNHQVHQFNPANSVHQFFDVGEVVGCIAPAGTHRLIMAQRRRLAFLDTRSGAIAPILTIEDTPPDTRFNDGKCDAAGRFWFGLKGINKPTGCLYRYDSNGCLQY